MKYSWLILFIFRKHVPEGGFKRIDLLRKAKKVIVKYRSSVPIEKT